MYVRVYICKYVCMCVWVSMCQHFIQTDIWQENSEIKFTYTCSVCSACVEVHACVKVHVYVRMCTSLCILRDFHACTRHGKVWYMVKNAMK
jgi:hypothetical protein